MAPKKSRPDPKNFFFPIKNYIQMNLKCRGALTQLLGKLRGRGELLFQDKPTLSLQALVNASWLWMNDMPIEVLEAHLRPYFEQMEHDYEELDKKIDAKKLKDQAAAAAAMKDGAQIPKAAQGKPRKSAS